MNSRYFFFIWFFFLISCSSPTIIDETEYFDNLVWNRFHFVEYEFDIEDVGYVYDVSVHFLHSPAYATDHISLNISLYFPGGGFRSRDYEFDLQDQEMQWLAELKDNYYKHSFLVYQNLNLSDAGTYRIRIENKMTKFNLTDVAGVGFKVIKALKK
ncbi:MAG: gliding motility lipoprotein GldH [Bacteroidales bacterium]|nr:gliding motility lipoprotein GldH [Bacteroidales bacterium]